MEPIFRRTFEITGMHTDRFNRLKPSALLYFVQETAGAQCDLMNLDWETLAKKKLFWAITRHRVQITRMPMKGETITVETWPMPTTRVAYPRSVVAYDSRGNEIFRTISLWVLMNPETRAMVLPGKSGVEISGILRGTELPAPGSLIPACLSARRTRQVCFSDLDINGHMNNTKYLDWVGDLLPSTFHGVNVPKEFLLCYNAEAREGDHLTMNWEMEDASTLRVDTFRDGENGEESHRIFSARIGY